MEARRQNQLMQGPGERRPISNEAADALEIFGSVNSTDQQRSAIQTLVKCKALDAIRGEPQFKEGLNLLIRRSDIASPDELSEIFALVMRIGAVAKSVRRDIPKIFQKVLAQRPATAQVMSDPKDRLYLAQALKISTGGWVAEYAAKETVTEESGEKARMEMLEALLAKSASLDSAIELINFNFKAWQTNATEVGSSRARRLQRVLQALHAAILTTELPAGSQIGEALEGLIRSAVGGHEIADGTARVDAAIAVLEIVHAVVRLHFSLATEPATYLVLAEVRRLFTPASWPDRLRKSLMAVAMQVEEAIELLAKQGITDNKLRAVLDLLLGEPAAKQRLRRMGERLTGLEPNVQIWLSAGGVARTMRATPLASETQLREADRRIAALHRESLTLKDLLAKATRRDRLIEDDIKRLSLQTQRVLELIESLVFQRGIQVRGEPGHRVPYTNLEHDLGHSPTGTRFVKIIRPLVERRLPNGISDVILKADVEPID